MGTLVERPLPTIFGGVSRQPNTVRRTNQVQTGDNALFSVVTGGFEKRPATQFIKKLAGLTVGTTYAVHDIDRSATEQFIVMLAEGEVFVFDAINGDARTVNTNDSVVYLAIEETGIDDLDVVETPDTRGQAAANRKMQLAWDSAETQVVWDWKLTDAATVFDIEGSDDGSSWVTLASGLTGATGTTTTTLDAVLTNDHKFVRANITTQAGAATDTLTLTATFKDRSYLLGADPEDFAFVSVADFTFIANRNRTVRLAEAASGTVTGTKQQFSDLPAAAGTGNIWRVQGADADGFATFYVKDDTATSTWVETVDPNAHNEIAVHTMPYQLVREADGTFTFGTAAWAAREVGDEEVVEKPLFIDKKIADIFFFRNRLGVLADDSVKTTRSGDVLNFWPEKAVETLDTDPVDRGAPATDVSLLQWAAPFRKILFVTSDRDQFELTATDVFTPEAATFDLATSYIASRIAKPKTMGDVLYFAAAGNKATVFYEYFFDEASLANDAADVTAHVPEYIPNDTLKIATDVTTGTVFVLTSGEQNSVYVYKTFFDGNKKIQSAWGRYIFAPDEANGIIHGITVMSGFLVLVIERPDGVFLEQMPIEREANDTALGFAVLLDQRDVPTGVYDATNDCTTWSLNWEHNDDAEVVLSGNFSTPGRILTTIYPDRWTLTLNDAQVNDSLDINGLTFTGKDATTTANREFDRSGTDIQDAGALTTVINDATDGVPGVTATDNGDGTVTLNVDDACDDTITLANVAATITTTEVKDQVAARGDFSAGSTYVGRPYTLETELSKPFVRQNASDDSSAVLNGRFQLKNIRVAFVDTGYFRIETTPENRDTNSVEFAGRILGSSNPIDASSIVSAGTLTSLVQANAETAVVKIINDKPLPSVITSAVFRGFFNEISRQE